MRAGRCDEDSGVARGWTGGSIVGAEDKIAGRCLCASYLLNTDLTVTSRVPSGHVCAYDMYAPESSHSLIKSRDEVI